MKTTKTQRATKTQETAVQAYTRNRDACIAKLAEIRKHLADHYELFNRTDRRSFGFAGDLGHALELLTEVADFISGDNR